MTRADRIEHALAIYAPQDEHREIDTDHRYLLVQQWNGDDYFLATFATIDAAAAYQSGDEWSPIELLDLDTGDQYEAETTFTRRPAR